MVKQLMAVVLCGTVALGGCASAPGPAIKQDPQAPARPAVDRTVMADYVQRIPAGSKVRLERTDGHTLRGTLMKATAETVVVQQNTRVPEPPIEVPVASIARLTLDQGASAGKSIAIGVATGVGATFAFFALLAAILGD